MGFEDYALRRVGATDNSWILRSAKTEAADSLIKDLHNTIKLFCNDYYEWNKFFEHKTDHHPLELTFY